MGSGTVLGGRAVPRAAVRAGQPERGREDRGRLSALSRARDLPTWLGR